MDQERALLSDVRDAMMQQAREIAQDAGERAQRVAQEAQEAQEAQGPPSVLLATMG